MTPIGSADTSQLLRQVNLNHLVYFWAVARFGSFTEAARRLGVSQPTLSEQVRSLQARLGQPLLRRKGRNVVLTDAGVRAYQHAEEAVANCARLIRTVQDQDPVAPIEIGVADSIPKVIVRSLLDPLISAREPYSLRCREWRTEHLMQELALKRLDMVICDDPAAGQKLTRLHSRRVGESTVTLCATEALARTLRRDFPSRLRRASWLMPSAGTRLYESLRQWLSDHGISPSIVVEADDRALLHHFAESGRGVVPVATATLPDIRRQFGLRTIGVVPGVIEEYHAFLIEKPDARAAARQEVLRRHIFSLRPGPAR